MLVIQDWQTIDREVFTLRANHQRSFSAKEIMELGSYNTLMQNQPLYDSEAHSFEASHDLFRSTFSEGFAWELLEVFSGERNGRLITTDLTVKWVVRTKCMYRETFICH